MQHIIDLTRNPNIRTAAGAREWFNRHPPIQASVSHTHHANSDDVTPTAANIILSGDPQVQSRLRCVTYGIFDPQKTFKTECRRRLKVAFTGDGVRHFPIFAARTHVCVTATFNVVRMNKDIDNLLKLILDVLSGVVYANDVDVTMVVAKKQRATLGDDNACTILTIESITTLTD